MKKDWISAGRRPTGLCGAALLLASKAFEINRSVSDIVRVVNISETVIRKRMDEFRESCLQYRCSVSCVIADIFRLYSLWAASHRRFYEYGQSTVFECEEWLEGLFYEMIL